MIGLEYILNLYEVQQKELAEELGINKQNITLWIKGKQNIPKKYLPLLEKRFNVSCEYFQKQLSELDKKQLEKNKLDKYIDESVMEFDDVVWDKENNDYIPIKKLHYDDGAIEQYRMIEAEEKEIIMINKIKSVVHDINDFYMFESYLAAYVENVEIFDRYADIIKSHGLENGFIHEVLRAVELCIPELKDKRKILGKDREVTSSVEDERELTQELYRILNKYLKLHKKKRKQLEEEAKWLAESFPNTDDDLF